MEVSSEPGFRKFQQKGDDHRPCVPFRNMEGTKHRKSRGCKTRKEVVEDKKTTDLSGMTQ